MFTYTLYLPEPRDPKDVQIIYERNAARDRETIRSIAPMRYYDFDKTAARREFQKRNYLFFGLFFGAILGLPILSYLFRLIGIEGALGFIILPWMLAWVAVGIWRTCWSCPRCHQYFFQKWWYGNAFSMRCLHCDLRPDELIEDFIPKNR